MHAKFGLIFHVTIWKKLVFERKCLRACTRMFRTSQSNYLKYVSNKSLYDKANIVRIDNFIIQLIRNYIIRSTITYEHNLILMITI